MVQNDSSPLLQTFTLPQNKISSTSSPQLANQNYQGLIVPPPQGFESPINNFSAALPGNYFPSSTTSDRMKVLSDLGMSNLQSSRPILTSDAYKQAVDSTVQPNLMSSEPKNKPAWSDPIHTIL